MIDLEFERRVRDAAMAWLDALDPTRSRLFRYDDVSGFAFEGERIPLLPTQQGIRKPAVLSAALSIRTTYTPAGEAPPYNDTIGLDGWHRYKYRGTNPQHHENVALRMALKYHLPLIWFVGAYRPGFYFAVYPVSVIEDEIDQLQFVIALDKAEALFTEDNVLRPDHRTYAERMTRQRLHQPLFRAQVLQAYQQQCAMCRLRHVSLLDAAHILPDGHPRGLPVVSNGLSLCKIHHAAYDENILGIRPDLVVAVRSDIRDERDGPMLLHGLQEMDGTRLVVPASRSAQPDPARLEERWETFLRAV